MIKTNRLKKSNFHLLKESQQNTVFHIDKFNVLSNAPMLLVTPTV